MKVYDLIEMLQECDPESEVMVGYNYGDRGQTNSVGNIRAVELEVLKETCYSDGKYCVDKNADPNDLDVLTAVVINTVPRGYC